MIVIETEHGSIGYETKVPYGCVPEHLLGSLKRWFDWYKIEGQVPLGELHLVMRLEFDGCPWSALPFYYKNDSGHMADIFMDLGELLFDDRMSNYYHQLLHHEIYHVIEALVLKPEELKLLEIEWTRLSLDTAWDDDDATAIMRFHNEYRPKGYASQYARTSPAEDRAETFSLVLVSGAVERLKDQTLVRKSRLLKSFLPSHLSIITQ